MRHSLYWQSDNLFTLFYGTSWFITLVTRARRWIRSWAIWIGPAPLHPVLFFSCGFAGERLCRCGTVTATGPTVYPAGDRSYMSEYEAAGEWYWQGKPKNSERNLSQFNSVSHKSHVDWARTRTSTIRSLRLTAWAVVRPHSHTVLKFRFNIILLSIPKSPIWFFFFPPMEILCA
jgi:hypothetical protein